MRGRDECNIGAIRYRPVYDSAARLLRTSRSSAMVSLRPLPFGRETQDLVPSPMTKMFEILKQIRIIVPHKKLDDSSPGSKGPLEGVLDVDNVEATDVLLAVHNDTRTTPVTATGDEGEVTGVELDEVGDLALLNVEADSVVDLDRGVGVTDGTAVVGGDERNALVADRNLANLQQLVRRLLRCDAVDREAALDVVEETEVLARLLDGDDIY